MAEQNSTEQTPNASKKVVGSRPGGMMRGPAAGAGAGEKPKDFKKTLFSLLSYYARDKVRVFVAFVTSILAVAASVSAPKLLGNATNILMDGVVSNMATSELLKMKPKIPGLTDAQYLSSFNKDMIMEQLNKSGQSSMADMLKTVNLDLGHGINFGSLTTALLLVATLYIASFFLQWVMGWCIVRMTNSTIYKLRSEIEDKIWKLPLKYFDGSSRGDVMSRTTNDLDNISQTLQQSTTQFLQSVLTIIGIIIMMLTISPILSLIALIVVPLSVVFAMFIMKKSQPEYVKQWKSTGDLNGHVEEAFTGHTVVKVFGKQDEQVKEFMKHNNDLSDASFKSQFLSGLIQPISTFLSNLSYVLVAIVGGLQVASGQLSLGNVQAFIQYSRQFNQPISQLASMVTLFQSALASAERVFELLGEEEESADDPNSIKVDRVEGRVEFDSVDFSYDKSVELIKDFNLKVKKGETIAIVGPTGAGKTTLVNLIMRFYDVDKGSISIDDIGIMNMSRHDLRKNVGMVLQDTWLFNGTVEENLRYGLHEGEDISDEEFARQVQATQIDSVIRKLPDGYDTIVSNENETLSQGERQLLTIARASLANPDILILDEATSSVDTRTEVLVQAAMKKLQENRTSFVIAHRLSTIRNADTILLLENGRITEQGNHDELMALNGEYSRLYNSQFELS